MSDIKPWQIILIIAAVAVLAFSGWRMMSANRIDSPSGYMTVDVITGQLYLIQKGKAKGMLLPALHPETKDRTLYPVIQNNETKEWSLDTGYSESISKKMIANSTAITGKSMINILDEDPIVFVLKK